MSLRINSEELWTISSNADDIAPVSDELFEQLGYVSLLRHCCALSRHR
jgi:hypothetical protein